MKTDSDRNSLKEERHEEQDEKAAHEILEAFREPALKGVSLQPMARRRPIFRRKS